MCVDVCVCATSTGTSVNIALVCMPVCVRACVPRGDRVSVCVSVNACTPHTTQADPKCAFLSAPFPTSPILPANVTGELALTQGLQGPLDNGTYLTRGYTTPASQPPFISKDVRVGVAKNKCPQGQKRRQLLF